MSTIKVPTPFGKDYQVGWEEFHRNTRRLAEEINRLWPEIDGIVAITRGGLFPAGMVARELNIRVIETFCVELYQEFEAGEATIYKRPELFMEDGGLNKLIVDDLVDKGGTMRVIGDLLPKAKRATVYAKPKGIPATNIFVVKVPQRTWLHFPWDLEQGRKIPLRGPDS